MTRCKNYYAGRALLDGWDVEFKFANGCAKAYAKACVVHPHENDYRVLPDAEGWLPAYDTVYPSDAETTEMDGVPCWRPKPIDPYAELKAQNVEGNEYRMVNVPHQDNWTDCPVALSWCYPPENYEFRPKTESPKTEIPKTKIRKIKLLTWFEGTIITERQETLNMRQFGWKPVIQNGEQVSRIIEVEE